MTMTEIAGAFSQKSPAASKVLVEYLRATEQADPAAPLPENISEWQVWDELELLAFWYTPERKWEPRTPLKKWLDTHAQNAADTAVILVSLISDMNIPSESAIPLDFFIPTAEIREWTYRALLDVREHTGNAEYMPDLPPTVRAQFQEWDQGR